MSGQIKLGTQRTLTPASGYVGMWLGAQDGKSGPFQASGGSSIITLSTPQTWFSDTEPTRVKLRSTTALPTGLSATTIYFAVKTTTSIVQLAVSFNNALNGIFVSPSDGGTGTHTIYKATIDDVSGQENHLLFEAAGMTDTTAFGNANYMSSAAGSSGQCFSLAQSVLTTRWADPYDDLFVLAFRSRGTLPGSTAAILGNSTGASVPGFRLRTTAAGLASPTLDRNVSGVTSLGSTVQTAFAAGSEKSFVMFLDGKNARIDVYIDGVIDNTFNSKDIGSNLTESLVPFAGPFYFGGNSVAATQTWLFRWVHMLIAPGRGLPNNKAGIALWLHRHGHMLLPQSLWGL